MNPVDAKYKIADLELCPYRPKGRDKKFFRDINKRISEGKYLSPGQGRHLNKIVAREKAD